MRQLPKRLPNAEVAPQALVKTLDDLARIAGIKDASPGVVHGSHDTRKAIVQLAKDVLRGQRPALKRAKARASSLLTSR